jgi:hypothetical protein
MATDLYEEADKKLKELKNYMQNLKEKADKGGLEDYFNLLIAQWGLAIGMGKKCPPRWYEITDGAGQPTGCFMEK